MKTRHHTVKFLPIALLVLSLGCRPEPTVAARVGDLELSVDQLTNWLVAWEDRPAERDYADQFVLHWVHLNLLAERSARGDSLLDSATVMAAMWPDVLEFRAADFILARFDREFPMEGTRVDSIYAVPRGYRVVWHRLHRFPIDGTAADSAQTLEAARAERAELVRGNPWTLVTRVGENGQTLLRRGGGLDLFGPGQTQPAFEEAMYALDPGAVAPLVRGPSGYHLVYRPTLREVRADFITWTKRDMFATYDSTYNASLRREADLELAATPQRIRDIAEAPLQHMDSDEVIGTYRGGQGTFVAGDLVRWIQFVPVDMNRELSESNDERTIELVTDMVGRELLIERVDAAQVPVADSVYTWLRDRLERGLIPLWSGTDLSPEAVMASGETDVVRLRTARTRVNTYLDGLTSARHGQVRIHPFLAGLLRKGSDWEIIPRGVERAVERASAFRESR